MSSKSLAKRSKAKRPTFAFEDECEGLACGLDEVGRAPLAGPVVAACVYIPPEHRRAKIWKQVDDSKKLSPEKRAALFDEIPQYCVWAFGQASPREIETLNIVHASFLAMRRAYETLIQQTKFEMPYALVDGNLKPQFPCEVRAIIKGDSKSVSIAAASILAKVTRDRMMQQLHEEYPHYGWISNVGYPTRTHLDAIEKHGITDYHRRTFEAVRNFIEFGSITQQMKLAI